MGRMGTLSRETTPAFAFFLPTVALEVDLSRRVVPTPHKEFVAQEC